MSQYRLFNLQTISFKKYLSTLSIASLFLSFASASAPTGNAGGVRDDDLEAAIAASLAESAPARAGGMSDADALEAARAASLMDQRRYETERGLAALPEHQQVQLLMAMTAEPDPRHSYAGLHSEGHGAGRDEDVKQIQSVRESEDDELVLAMALSLAEFADPVEEEGSSASASASAAASSAASASSASSAAVIAYEPSSDDYHRFGQLVGEINETQKAQYIERETTAYPAQTNEIPSLDGRILDLEDNLFGYGPGEIKTQAEFDAERDDAGQAAFAAALGDNAEDMQAARDAEVAARETVERGSGPAYLFYQTLCARGELASNNARRDFALQRAQDIQDAFETRRQDLLRRANTELEFGYEGRIVDPTDRENMIKAYAKKNGVSQAIAEKIYATIMGE